MSEVAKVVQLLITSLQSGRAMVEFNSRFARAVVDYAGA